MRHRALLTALFLALCAGVVGLATTVSRRPAGQPPELDGHVLLSREVAVTPPGASGPWKPRPWCLSSRSVLTTLLLGLCVCTVAFVQTGPGRRVAESIGISSPAEPFTALYFNQPAQLGPHPPRADAAQHRETVSFAIRSHERTGRTYAWIITTGTGRRLAAGTAAVSAGGGALIKRIVTVCPSREAPTHPLSVQILVALANPAESISYRTQCHG